MEVSQKKTKKSSKKTKESLKIPDDPIQVTPCNHVVVNITAKSKDKKESSYCVMCGAVVDDTDEISQRNTRTVEDLKLDNLTAKGTPSTPTSLESSRSEKRQSFASSRTSSTSSLSSTTPTVSSSNNMCSIHSHKKLKYFCEDHQEIGCSVCVNVLHRGCERIMFIKDEVQTSNWTEDICKDTISALNAISDGFKGILDYTASSREKLNAQVVEFRKTRDELRSHLERILDEFDERSERKIKQYQTIFQQEMLANENICTAMIKETELNVQALEETLTSNSTSNTFIVTQKVLQQRERYGIALSNAIRNSQDISIDLVPEKKITSIDELKRIGKIHISANTNVFPESVMSAVSKLPKPDMRSPRTARDARSESSSSLNNQATFVGKFSVRLEEDKKTCENVGAMFLNDGRVAILDNANRNLKLFDSKFSQPCSLSLSSDPRDVTSVSPQEVAITLPDEGKILIVSTMKKLQMTRSILTDLPCYGITTHNQQLVVLCNDGFKTIAIQILDFDGKVIKTLPMNQSGKTLLTKPWNIALSVDGQQVCVTDKNRLVNFNMNGDIIFDCRDKDLEDARGLVVDESGRFYVCCTGSNNVHRVTADGEQRRVILTNDDVMAPQAVCYQPEKRLLLLTSAHDDYVYLYKIAKS